METKADTSFFIDRMQGFGICVPVIAGIVQPYHDHEYKGHLSSKTVGQHINVLKEIVETRLYKTRVQNNEIHKAFVQTKFKIIEWNLFQLNKRLGELDKTHIVEPSKSDTFYNYTRNTYQVRLQERYLNITQTKAQIEVEQKRLIEAKAVIDAVKLKIFNEHGIQY